MATTPCKVLIVEDNVDYADSLRLILKASTDASYDVEVVGRLEAALRRLSLGDIEAVLLDLTLPDWKGTKEDVIRQVRIVAPTVGIIVVTGWGDDGTQLAAKAGADAFMVKPADPFDMIAKLRLTVGHRRIAIDHHQIEKTFQRMGVKIAEFTELLEQGTAALEKAKAANDIGKKKRSIRQISRPSISPMPREAAVM